KPNLPSSEFLCSPHINQSAADTGSWSEWLSAEIHSTLRVKRFEFEWTVKGSWSAGGSDYEIDCIPEGSSLGPENRNGRLCYTTWNCREVGTRKIGKTSKHFGVSSPAPVQSR